MVTRDSRLVRALRSGVFVLALTFLAACGARQVCECAVHVGGTTPATPEEQTARNRAVNQCLEAHGGGTIAGCPMPASAPSAPEAPPTAQPE